MRKFLCALGLFSILILITPLAMPQSLVSGDISGTVSDPSGAVIKDAIVNLKSLDTGAAQTTATGDTGLYRFSLLRPGRYTLTVTQQGFQGAERTVTVAIGQVTTANFTLTVGKATEIVEVTGALPIVNTESANATTSYDQRAVTDMPNPGGDLTNIAQLAPGITMVASSGSYGNFNANGLPTTANLFTVNGENIMDPYFNINNTGATNLTLGLNEVQEATVITNAYSGQYGQQAGAQVNYITKGGTNAFHGSAKYLWNGRVMNANDWFANNAGEGRPFANNNQWGADFGGPIKKDKTFFYVNTEGIRYVTPTVQSTYVPSPQFTSAVLANIANVQPNSLPLYKKLFDLWSNPNTPGAQNARPVTTGTSCGDIIDPETGASSLAGITASTPCAMHFSSSPGQLSTEWIISGRLDHNFSDNDRVFFRFGRDDGLQPTYTDPIRTEYNGTSQQPQYDGQAQWNHIFSGTMTNQFIVSGKYYSAIFKQDPAKVSPFPYTMLWYEGDFSQTSNGYLGAGGNFATIGFPQGRNVTQYQFIDDLSLVRGNHSLKFGVNFRRYDMSDYTIQWTNPGLYILSTTDFANGSVYQYRQRITNRDSFPVANYGLGMYGQDEWKVTKDLKLTLALRLEHNSNPVCQVDCFARFVGPIQGLNIGPDIPYNQNILAGQHQGFASTDSLNVSPRFGFVWSPGGSAKTVISGGFGVFYDSLPSTILLNAFRNVPGIVDQRVLNTNTAGLWADPTTAGSAYIATTSAHALMSGFASGATYNSLRADTGNVFRAPTFYNFDGTMHTPRYQEWSLQVQRELGSDMSFTLSYAGTHGIHIPINNGGLNGWDPGYGSGLPDAAPYRNYATLYQWSTVGVSNSNNLTASLQRRFSRGVSFQFNYTWAHALDEVSNGGVSFYGDNSMMGQINPYDLRTYNYGNADYDIRHNFTGTFTWEPPHKFASKIVNGFLGGWNFNGTIFAHSGVPYTVIDDNAQYNNYALLFLPGQPLGPGTAYGSNGCSNPNVACFDPNAFVDLSTTGMLSGFPAQRRNQYRGPGFFIANFSPTKSFNLTERMKLNVGANFYNVFNNVNFNVPNNALTSGAADVGHITSTISVPASPYGSFTGSAASARIIQLQARISF